jgi:parvulin-like peptidyl-prolyl isomerase
MIEQFVFASPAAMKKEYESHPERYQQEAKVSVRVILLKPAKEGEGVPSLGTRWAQIGEELAAGASFSDMAIKYSSDSHAKDGGLWADVNPEEAFRPEIANAIAKLDVGRVSSMIDLDGWGFIVKKESETKAKQMSFAEAYDKIAANVQKAAAKKAYDEWIVRLKDTSFIKIYPMPKE